MQHFLGTVKQPLEFIVLLILKHLKAKSELHPSSEPTWNSLEGLASLPSVLWKNLPSIKYRTYSMQING